MKGNIFLSGAVIVMVLLLTIYASGCTQSDKTEIEDPTLNDIVEKLYENVDVPLYEIVTLDESNFEFYAFAPYESNYTAVAADALVNITPHSLVVIHTSDGTGAELARTTAANADMNKWLCVGSEAGKVAYTDHYVVLIMSEKAIVDDVIDNFTAMSEKLDNMKIKSLSLTNSRYEQ